MQTKEVHIPFYLQTGAPPATPIFRIEYNHIHDYGLGILSDFAGVYMSTNDNLCFQKDPMTCFLPVRVHNNVIRDCSHYNYGCNGVYMDEQVSGVAITSNIIYNMMSAGVYFHCGTQNSASNNIIANADTEGKAAKHSGGTTIGGCNKGGNPTWSVKHRL